MRWIAERYNEASQHIPQSQQGEGFLNALNTLSRGQSVDDLARQLIEIPLSFKNIFYVFVALFFFLHLIYRVTYIIGATESGEASSHKEALKNAFVFIIVLVPLIELMIALIGWFTGMNFKW